MTEAEQHRIIGEAVLKLAEARKRRACLQARAERVAEDLEKVCTWLRGSRPIGSILNEEMTVPDAVALLFEIDKAATEVGKLEEKCRELGVQL